MNVIAFLGSPRKGGNSETLLNEAIRGVEDAGHKVAHLFDLNQMNIRPCQNCSGCEETGCCIVKDDMQEVSAALREADRIILASPIFFSGVSAQTKAMIDRTQAFWCEKYLLKKPVPPGPHGRRGLFIVVGGQKKPQGVECAKETVRIFFSTINVRKHRTLAYRGIDAKGDIQKYTEALKEVYNAAIELVSDL